MRINKSFIFATLVLIIGSSTAAAAHWFAHTDQDFRFTIIGFMSAIFAGMYYGLSVNSDPVIQFTSKTSKT